MLDPTPLPAEAVPSSFLPYLHRDQTTLSPFSPHTLLGHIALLRELYLPPIHGGFRPIDVSDLDDRSHSPRSTKERRFSAGLAETMDGLGLGLVVGSPSRQPVIADTIFEHDEDNERDDETSEGKAEASTDHLEPFERDWAERWLNGVVRRAQSWLEEHEAHEDLHGFVAADGAMTAMKGIEVVLRDATAVLAMMAGTSGAYCCRSVSDTHGDQLLGL